LHRGVEPVLAFVFGLAGEFDDQNRIFGGEADQHDEPDLRQDIYIRPAKHEPADCCEQAHRHDQDDRERQAPAFVLCRQHEKNENYRRAEDEKSRIAGELLLISEIRPVEPETVGEPFGGELFHRRQRISSRVTRQCAPLDLGGGIKVVAWDTVRAGDIAELSDRADRHHLAPVVPRLQIDDVVDVVSKRSVGLRRHPIGAAEIVEVVNIGRAEIDLQRLEHTVGRNFEHLGADPIDVGIDLGCPRVE